MVALFGSGQLVSLRMLLRSTRRYMQLLKLEGN